jgi:cell division protein FtsL
MARIRYNKHALRLNKQRRCSLSKHRFCLRTECLLFSILIGLLAMTVTWGSSKIVNAGYELMESRECLTKIEKQNEALRVETAQLKSQQRIQDIAVGQLGMINPETVYMHDKELSTKRAVK